MSNNKQFFYLISFFFLSISQTFALPLALTTNYMAAASPNISSAAETENYVFGTVAQGQFFGISVDTEGTIYGAHDYAGLFVFVKQPNNTYTTTRYSTADGLGSNALNSVYVDGNDVIYAATADRTGGNSGGLSIGTKQANGRYIFSNYTTANGLVDNFVNSVYADTHGIVYAGTTDEEHGNGGLSIGTKQTNGRYTFTNYTTADGLGDNWVAGVYADTNGKVYVATTGLYDNGTGGLSIGIKQANGRYTFSDYTTADGLADNRVNGIYVDANGTLYAATYSGLSIGIKQVNGSYTFSNYTMVNGLGDNFVRSVYVDNTGTIYAGTVGGLSIGIKQTNGNYIFTNNTTDNGLDSNYAGSVYADASGTIYVATLVGDGVNAGLSVGVPLPSYTFTNYTAEKNNLIDDETSAVYANANNMFVATNGGLSVGTLQSDGSYSFNPANNYTYTNTNGGLGSDQVQAIYTDANNIIYAATTDGVSIGLPLNGGRYNFGNFIDGLGSPVVNDVVTDSNRIIYAATDNGVSVGTPQSNGLYTFQNYLAGLINPKVWAVAVDTKGTIYAAMTGGIAIGKGTPQNGYQFTTYSNLNNTAVQNIYVDSYGTIYAATTTGIEIGTQQSNGSYTFNSTNLNADVSSIVVNQNGTLYAATNTGVYIGVKLADGTYAFTPAQTQGLGSNIVLGIYAGNGIIYAATADGVAVGLKQN